MYLSSTERRHVALANGLVAIHEDFHEEALFSYWDALKPLSLNNAAQTFHSNWNTPNFLPVQHLRGCPIQPDLQARGWALRNWMYAMWRGLSRELAIRDNRLVSLSPRTIWRWRAVFREEIQTIEGIEDNDFKPFRKHNFRRCGSKWSTGKLTTYKNKQKVLTTTSCGESHCTKCGDASKKRTSDRWGDISLSLANSQSIERFWFFVVTFPRALEASIPKGSTVRNQFMNGLCKWVRRLFGLRAKDGLFHYANIHPVGDSDIMRDRFHVHIGVLPIAGRRVKGTTQYIHCDVDGLIDTSEALVGLEKLLSSVFPLVQRGKAQFKAEYIPMHTKATEPRIRHRLGYDLRGFGKDVELSPLFFNEANKLVILRAGEGGYGVYTAQQIAYRWRWIRSQRDCRSYGLLKQWENHFEALGVENIKDPEPEIEKEELVVVKRIYGRQWNPKTKQVRWVNEKRAYWKKSGKEIKGIEWGRKGSEGIWRVKKAAPPG